MKTMLNKLAKSGLILTLCASFALAPAAHASGGRSRFNPEEIERAIVDFYGFYDNRSPDFALSDVDKAEMADALADMVAVLRPTAFNDVLGHFAAEYRQNAKNREAIEILMLKSREKIARELQENRERHPVLTVIDDVFLVWTVTYSFGFGKGLWRSRGSGLQGLDRFKHVVRSVSENLPRGKRNALMIVGVGTTAGIIHAVYNHLETVKLDPRDLLTRIQADVVQELGTRMAGIRDELKAITPERLRLSPATYRDRFNVIDPEVSKMQRELEHLYVSAPHLRSRMQLIADDLRSVRTQLAQLSMQLDLLDYGNSHRSPIEGSGARYLP
jgi:hypothetical protein